jgi:ABC-type transport system substrate-binding protein
VALGAKVLKFVPQANLANFDPIWGTQYVVRNASQLVWDTLYGMDSKLRAKRQMVEGEEVSADGLTWTFKLRSGLKFHDGTPVTAKDYNRAVAGSDPALWKSCPSFFTPGTPFYTEAGGEPLKGKRDYDAAKKLLAEAAYSGQPVTCVVAQDQAWLKAMGEITADVLTKIGMTVDFVATDWGTVGQRRASKSPPGQGGRGMFHTWHAGSDCASPVGNIAIRTSGDKAWFGWPDNAEN